MVRLVSRASRTPSSPSPAPAHGISWLDSVQRPLHARLRVSIPRLLTRLRSSLCGNISSRFMPRSVNSIARLSNHLVVSEGRPHRSFACLPLQRLHGSLALLVDGNRSLPRASSCSPPWNMCFCTPRAKNDNALRDCFFTLHLFQHSRPVPPCALVEPRSQPCPRWCLNHHRLPLSDCRSPSSTPQEQSKIFNSVTFWWIRRVLKDRDSSHA